MCSSLGINFFHSCWYKHKKEIAGSYGNPMFNFCRNFKTVFHHGVLFCIPISSAWKFKYFHFFITLVLLCLSLEPYFWCALHAYLSSVYHYLVNFLFKSFTHFLHWCLSYVLSDSEVFHTSMWHYFFILIFNCLAYYIEKQLVKFYIPSVYFATLPKLILSFSYSVAVGFIGYST